MELIVCITVAMVLLFAVLRSMYLDMRSEQVEGCSHGLLAFSVVAVMISIAVGIATTTLILVL